MNKKMKNCNKFRFKHLNNTFKPKKGDVSWHHPFLVQVKTGSLLDDKFFRLHGATVHKQIAEIDAFVEIGH